MNPLTNLEPQDQEIGEIYVVQERRETDFEAPKLLKASSSIQDYNAKLSNEMRAHETFQGWQNKAYHSFCALACLELLQYEHEGIKRLIGVQSIQGSCLSKKLFPAHFVTALFLSASAQPN